MVVDGKYPCTPQEAAQFAAYQLQIAYGNFEPDKHKPGFVKLNEFLPPEYVKKKEVEKQVYVEYSRLRGFSELNAKFRYVQLSRSLKTFGTTFFLVKEPAVKKKKAATLLLGISKSSIVRMDIETKEILDSWRYGQLRRWAFTNKTFTLDFGDYAEKYYSVETQEGEEISLMIDGYVDILIKRQAKAKASSTEAIAPSGDIVIQDYLEDIPAEKAKIVGENNVQKSQQKQIPVPRPMSPKQPSIELEEEEEEEAPVVIAEDLEVNEIQQAIKQMIQTALATYSNSIADLSAPTHVARMSNDPATIKWQQETIDLTSQAIASNLSGSLAEVGALIMYANGHVDEMDFDLISDKIQGLNSFTGQISQSIKMLAGLQTEDKPQESLLNAGKLLCESTINLLNALLPLVMGNPEVDNFYSSAKVFSTQASKILDLIDQVEVSPAKQRELFMTAEEVGHAFDESIECVQKISATLKDPGQTQALESDMQLAGEIASQLEAVVLIMAPMIQTSVCRSQFMEMALLARDAAESLASSGQLSTNPRLVSQLESSVEEVETAIDLLVDRARFLDSTKDDEIDRCYDEIITAMNGIAETQYETGELINYAKLLTLQCNKLAEILKTKSLEIKGAEGQNLLKDAQIISEQTANMVLCAKEVVKSPKDNDEQFNDLMDVLDVLKDKIDVVTSPFIKASTTHKLIQCLKNSTSSFNQVSTAARNAATYNRDQASQLHLNRVLKKVVVEIPKVIQTIKACNAKPTDYLARVNLSQAAIAFMDPAFHVLNAAKAASFTTVNTSAKNQLLSVANQLNDELQELKNMVEIAKSLLVAEEIDGAIDSIKSIEEDIEKALSSDGAIQPPDSFDLGTSQADFSKTTANLQQNLTAISLGVEQENERAVGTVLAQVVGNIQTISSLSFGIAANTDDEAIKFDLLNAAQSICDQVSTLIGDAATAIQTPEALQAFKDQLEVTNNSVSKIIDCLPAQKTINTAIKAVKASVENLSDIKDDIPLQDAKENLVDSAIDTSMAVNILVGLANQDSSAFDDGANSFISSFQRFNNEYSRFSARPEFKDDDALKTILSEISNSCNGFLLALKDSNVGAAAFSEKALLLDAAKKVTSTINSLFQHLNIDGNGFEKYNQALESINEATIIIDNINEPSANNSSYAETALHIDAGSSTISDLVALFQVPNADKSQRTADSLVKLAEAVKTTINHGSRATYLIGVTDPLSKKTRPPIFDTHSIVVNIKELERLLSTLSLDSSDPKKILEAASNIGRIVGTVCRLGNTPAKNVPFDLESKQKMTVFVKDIASNSSQLVATLKQLGIKKTQPNIEKANSMIPVLRRDLNDVSEFINLPELAGSSAVLSEDSIELQKPFVGALKTIISHARELIIASQSVSLKKPKYKTDNAKVAQESKALGIKVSELAQMIRESGPMQKECDVAVSQLNSISEKVGKAIHQAASNTLTVHQSADKGALLDNLFAISNLSEVVTRACQNNSSELVHAVEQIPVIFERLADSSISYASSISGDEKSKILDQTTELQSLLSSMLLSIKLYASDSNDLASFQIETDKNAIRDAAGAIINSVQGISESKTEFEQASQLIESLLLNVDNLRSPTGEFPADEGEDTEKKSYQVLVHEIDQIGKQMVNCMSSVITKDVTENVLQYGPTSIKLSELYSDLNDRAGDALATADNEELKNNLQLLLREIGGSTIKVIEVLKQGSSLSQNGTIDASARLQISQSVRELSTKLGGFISVAKEGSQGVVSAQKASAEIDIIISDFESMLIFASAKQLDPPPGFPHYSTFKDALIRAASDLTDAVSPLINANSANQQKIAEWMGDIIAVSNVMKDRVQKGATSLTSADSVNQIAILSKGKVLFESLQALVIASANSIGMKDASRVVAQVASAVDQLVDNVKDLVEAMTNLDDDNRALKTALDDIIGNINDSVKHLTNDEPAYGTALPRDIANIARQLAGSAAVVVSMATSKQEGLVDACHQFKSNIKDLLKAGKAATQSAPEEEKSEILTAMVKVAVVSKGVIASVKAMQDQNSSEAKKQIQASTKEMSTAVKEVVDAAEKLIPEGYIDMNDPNVIAERELLMATASIEAAAKRLAEFEQAKPISSNESLNFEGQIVDAAKAISGAASILVKAATETQREIVAKGRRGTSEDTMYFSDGKWNDGLVSAAKLVANATGELCDAANKNIKGTVEPERVIATARAVSASTVQLVTAAAVRCDPYAKSSIGLSAAGKAVSDAIEELVKSAKKKMAEDTVPADVPDEHSPGVARSVIAEMEAQMNMLRMEKELDRARANLAQVRKKRYSNTPNPLSMGSINVRSSFLGNSPEPLSNSRKGSSSNNQGSSSNLKRFDNQRQSSFYDAYLAGNRATYVSASGNKNRQSANLASRANRRTMIGDLGGEAGDRSTLIAGAGNGSKNSIQSQADATSDANRNTLFLPGSTTSDSFSFDAYGLGETLMSPESNLNGNNEGHAYVPRVSMTQAASGSDKPTDIRKNRQSMMLGGLRK